VDTPLKSATHSQYRARPTVTFPAAEQRRPLTDTKLYCLATEARVCGQLAHGCYLQKVKCRQSDPRPLSRKSKATRSNLYSSRPHTQTCCQGRLIQPIASWAPKQPMRYFTISCIAGFAELRRPPVRPLRQGSQAGSDGSTIRDAILTCARKPT